MIISKQMKHPVYQQVTQFPIMGVAVLFSLSAGALH